ncbi:NAD(P)H-hydrate epimerase [Stenoxybacter acetivorans]|uniref:NAD(P)H-hydrate epimerase n=1 Tax=Stenoxybacter acetivorans TaxID=422441 RepID=UPI00056A0CD8|nr:NAD(P)H-hydrate epimerase [Stenoxybacter acetivorans]
MANSEIYTVAQMKEWETAARERGLGAGKLMENAGSRIAEDLMKRFPEPQKTLVICGNGNNGGDGLVTARYLSENGWAVAVLTFHDIDVAPLVGLNLAKLPDSVRVATEKQSSDVLTADTQLVIDAIFGIGFHDQLPQKVADCLKEVNAHNAFKVAIDIPSGVHADDGTAAENSFTAMLTYALQACKSAHETSPAKELCGEVVCINIE